MKTYENASAFWLYSNTYVNIILIEKVNDSVENNTISW